MPSLGRSGFGAAVASVILAVSLAGSACASTETSTVGGDPLVIGHLDTTRAYLDSGYFAVALAATHFNLAGGINGSPVVVVSRNVTTDAAQGVPIAQRTVDVDGAIAIVGPGTSVLSVAVIESIAAPRKVLHISPSATSPSLTTIEDSDFFFRTAVSDVVQGVVLANLAWEEGYRHMAVMHINDPYGQGLADQFEESFTALGGRVTKVSHESGKSSYKSELEEARMGGAEALVPISHDAQTTIYIRESIDGGYFDEFLLVDANKSPELIEAIGWETLEGALGTSPGTPLDRPQRRAFFESYVDYFGMASHEEAFVSESYDAAAVIGLAAAQAGAITDSEAIRDALRSVAGPPGEIVGPGPADIKRALALIADGKEINYQGASGDVDFDDNGDVAGSIEIWKVENGEIASTGRFKLP